MKLELKPLQQQVMVITGASSGIGRVTAREAAWRGARVVLVARGEEGLDACRQEIEQAGGNVLVVPCDVSDPAQTDALAEATINHYGRIDTWVNNASVALYGEFPDLPPEDVRRVIEVNLLGTMNGTRSALRVMGKTPGAIINVSSALGDRGLPLQSVYAAAKHGVRGFTESLRMELQHLKLPISVTTIKPASIDTPLFKNAKSLMGAQPKPMPPVYSPELVADAILHAATHPSRDISVGDAAVGLNLLQRIAPPLLDMAMKRSAYPTQKEDHPDDGVDNLHSPIPGPGRTHGGYNGTSLSAGKWMRERPRVRRLAVTSVALFSAIMFWRRGPAHR